MRVTGIRSSAGLDEVVTVVDVGAGVIVTIVLAATGVVKLPFAGVKLAVSVSVPALGTLPAGTL